MGPLRLNLLDVPAGLKWLGFDPKRECEASEMLFGSYWVTKNYEDVTIVQSTKFVRACVPISLSRISFGQVIDWYMLLKESKQSWLVNLSKGCVLHSQHLLHLV